MALARRLAATAAVPRQLAACTQLRGFVVSPALPAPTTAASVWPHRPPLRAMHTHGGDVRGDAVRVVFVSGDEEQEVTGYVGQNLLQVAHRNGVDMEGACEGSVACSTCHVILDDDVYDDLEEPTEEEDDMLDQAPGLTMTSRLGCQVVLRPEHDGMHVRLPTVTRNFYVDGHKPQPH